MLNKNGGVAEWFKAPVSKTGRLERVSRVQISSPPLESAKAEGEQVIELLARRFERLFLIESARWKSTRLSSSQISSPPLY